MLDVNEQKLAGIGQLLVLENLLDKAKALECHHQALSEKTPLVRYLVTHKILSAKTIASIIAHNFGVPLLDLNSIDIDTIPMQLVNESFIQRYAMVPLFTRGNDLYLAMDDPGQQNFLKEIQFHTGLNAQAIVVETDKLSALIERLIKPKENKIVHFSNELNGFDISSEDAPVVKFVDDILHDALLKRASDIHFEPFESNYRIRYRLDGILQEIATPPQDWSARVTARIKIMAKLDISERRIPQDGGFKFKLPSSKSIDFRVSTCPTTHGEKVVLRLLNADTAKLSIEALGFSPIQQAHFINAIRRPQGMILVTGPTGSGKTVTLYAALNVLNTSEVNISTVEDPVEIKVFGINQVQINPKTGLTFSSALGAFLRQDPDIIMVGEIRDLETAQIAVKAAQTGHLVLSTLHTNSASQTLNRLINIGIPTFNIAHSISLIIAQRLIRKLCEQCKQLRQDYTPESLLELGFQTKDIEKIKLYKAIGCSQCTNGYKGRIGVFEVLPMSKELGLLLMSGGNSLGIEKLAQSQGFLTLFQSGLEKIKLGITTLEEVNRVTVD